MAFRPSHRAGLLLLVAIVLSFSACKKETEIQLKEVDKVYSWQADQHLYGLSKIILGMGKDASSLYLQTPNSLGQLSPGARSGGVRYFANISLFGWVPSDVNVRIPIAADMYAWPAADTVVMVTPNAEAASSQSSVAIRLLQLDPQATTYKVYFAETDGGYRFATLNRNSYLLMGYRRTAAGGPSAPDLRLLLSHVTFNANQRLQAQTQLIDFPGISTASYPRLSQITAIDDYFLVGNENEGIFKVLQNGTIRRVSTQKSIVAFYKWQNKVYAQTFTSLLVSADNGETWTTYANTPSFLRTSGFRLIGDSLVGFVRPFNQLYSLRWNGGIGQVRELKNDGLGEAAITDIQQLGDTVYVGTTSGLYKRLKTVFFESKPQ